jgi:uncharacterized membrane protein
VTRRSPNTAAHRPKTILAHHRLLICAALGAAIAVAWPGVDSLLGRVLLGWNVLTWTYLAWVVVMLRSADQGHMKRAALAQAENAGTVLSVVVIAAVTSLVAVVFELAAAKAAGPSHMLGHAITAFVTVVGSWLLLPVLFALRYAAAYYEPEPDVGLDFPGATPGYEPDHTDFFYFAFTIAVTAQTSDVAVTSRRMRRLVLLQSVLSFVFNTTILAFSINAAASFF